MAAAGRYPASSAPPMWFKRRPFQRRSPRIPDRMGIRRNGYERMDSQGWLTERRWTFAFVTRVCVCVFARNSIPFRRRMARIFQGRGCRESNKLQQQRAPTCFIIMEIDVMARGGIFILDQWVLRIMWKGCFYFLSFSKITGVLVAISNNAEWFIFLFTVS